MTRAHISALRRQFAALRGRILAAFREGGQFATNAFNPDQPRNPDGTFAGGAVHDVSEHELLPRTHLERAKQIRDKFKAEVEKVTDVPVLRQIKSASAFCKKLTGKMYAELSSRYGRSAAMAIMASGQAVGWGSTAAGALAGVPIFLPGSSLWGALPGVALAETILQVSKLARRAMAHNAELDIDALGQEFWDELVRKYRAYFKGIQRTYLLNAFNPDQPRDEHGRWLSDWTSGTGEDTGGVFKVVNPSDATLKALAKSRHYREYQTVYRSHRKGAPHDEYESWAKDRELADIITESEPGRETLVRKVHRSEVVFSGEHVHQSYKPHVVATEVVIAHGDAHKRMARIRGEMAIKGEKGYGTPVTNTFNPDQARDAHGRWMSTGDVVSKMTGRAPQSAIDAYAKKNAGRAPGDPHDLSKVPKGMHKYFHEVMAGASQAPAPPSPLHFPQEKGAGPTAAHVMSVVEDHLSRPTRLPPSVKDVHDAVGGGMFAAEFRDHLYGMAQRGEIGLESYTRPFAMHPHPEFLIPEPLMGTDRAGIPREQYGYVTRPRRRPEENSTVYNWAPTTSTARLNEFQGWLRQQVGQTLTGHTQEQFWEGYIHRGWQQGAARAFDDTNRARPRISQADDIAYQGGRQQFLRDSFNHPVNRERVDLLASRTFDEMENVGEDMVNRLSRTLVDGLIQGQGADEIARNLVDATGFSLSRAETVARTEVVRAHAEGQLDGFEQLGVEELGVQAEIKTSGRSNVCEECAALEGQTFSIDEARGMIPVHPSCACAWIPNLDET